MDYAPIIPRIFATMKAPPVSRTFYVWMNTLHLWSLFVGLLKFYARRVKPSRHITLDGIDGGPRRPYLTRWHLIPRNRWFNIYLHYFEHGDDDRALHDHPWASASLLLDGDYIECTSEFVPDTGTSPVTWFELFNLEDGRSYVHGSLPSNSGKFPGLDKFDYQQVFVTGDFRRLAPDHLHMIRLFGDNNSPVWTLFITGRIVRRWGFACPQGWRDFKEYTADHPTRPNATVGCE